MGRHLQLGRYFARADRCDPYDRVQFRIAAGGVTGWSAPVGQSM
jgi:hypothetical protein